MTNVNPTSLTAGPAKDASTRLMFLQKVAAFADSLTRKQGRCLTHEERRKGHLHTLYELLNFGDFSFRFDSGLAVTGGNVLQVWHHPKKRLVSTEMSEPVLNVYWRGVLNEDAQIRMFMNNMLWQRELLALMHNCSRIEQALDRAAPAQATSTT